MISYGQFLEKSLENFTYATILDGTGILRGFEQWKEKDLTSAVTLSIVAVGWPVFCICGAIYRLYFDPLAKIPGPKLAAMTTWYEAYYDVWLGGKYIFKIAELHKEYGPLIRINPHEIHCNDPNFIDDIFPGATKKTNKYRFTGRRTMTKNSMVATIQHDVHRQRRGAVANFFSSARIRKLEPIITISLEKILGRMESASKTGEVMSLNYVFKAATSDIITKYAFGNSTNFLDYPDYNMPFMKAVDSVFKMNHALMHFPWLGPLLEASPRWFCRILAPGLFDLMKMQEVWKAQVEDIRNSPDPDAGKDTIFYGILHSNLPPEEKTTARLGHEAQLTVLAGQDTTGTTLSFAVFELLANPASLKKLRAELVAAIHEPKVVPTYSQVEALPYLGAVVQEILRLHPSVVSRLPRVSPYEDVVYKNSQTGEDYNIPAGTSMNMTTWVLHTNPEVFQDPFEFIPERWIENPRLDKSLIAFAKGTRNCLGMNLARQELFTIIAGIFRKYDLYDGTGTQTCPTLELYDTERARDVDMNSDMIIPYPAEGSHGVRVVVRH
ncbi:cytochrome P450 [Patellaria atrata CBS 101060]|uniref:Cytochrome P450 n=1 Tax=Patellaria atrata CBS 101060 TaxID=1346257 RepID=A0A9P4VRL0_9PEZI|nr:cytochrome P450 [Patellaria atrata CBS 101060]